MIAVRGAVAEPAIRRDGADGVHHGASLLRHLLRPGPIRTAAIAAFVLLVVTDFLSRPPMRSEFPLLEHLGAMDAFHALVNQVRYALLLLLGLAIADRFPITGGRRRNVPAAVLLAMLGAVVVHAVIVFGVYAMVPRAAPIGFPDFVGRVGSALNIPLAFLMAGYAIQLVRQSARQESDGYQLEADLVGARLSGLTMQLQPHFLYNALHSVSSLMHEDPAAAERVLARLRVLLHTTLHTQRTVVSLAEEIEFIRLYTGIEQVRFSDRLDVRIEVDPVADRCLVPHLLLQPLVENSIRHGIARRAGAGTIRIRATADREFLDVAVWDSGPGLRAGWSVTGVGVGLSNTIARLDHLYGDRYEFDLTTPPGGGTLTTLRLPRSVGLRRTGEVAPATPNPIPRT